MYIIQFCKTNSVPQSCISLSSAKKFVDMFVEITEDESQIRRQVANTREKRNVVRKKVLRSPP